MKKMANQVNLSALLAMGLSFAAMSANSTHLDIPSARQSIAARAFGTCAKQAKADAKGEKNSADKAGAEIAVRAEYSRTWDSAKLGQYFGITSGTVNFKAAPGTDDVNVFNLIRAADGGPAATSSGIADGSVVLSPRQTRFAVHVDYTQNFDTFLEGSWMRLGAAFAWVKNELQPAFTGGADSGSAASLSLTDFFSGVKPAVGDGLQALKIPSSSSVPVEAETHVDSADLRLGYNFVRNDNGEFGAYVVGTAGLGTEPTEVMLFESLVGSRHFALGLGLCGNFSMMKNDDSETVLRFDLDGSYVFPREDYRVATITTSGVNWGQYHHIVEVGGTEDGSTVTGKLIGSAANVLRQKVNVKPRFHVNALVALGYMRDSFGLDLGYMLHYRAKEDNAPVTAWTDGKYFRTNVGTGKTAVLSASTGTAINGADLNWSQDAKVLHTLHACASYTMQNMDTPVQFGVGGSFTLANDKAKAEQHWSLFGKVGIAF